VCDQVVDIYAQVADELTQDVDEVEFSVFSDERTNDSTRIYVLKRELAEVRRAVMPLRDPMSRFSAGVVDGIHTDSGPYFRDVGDHLSRIADTVDTLDSLLSAAFEAHLAQISIRQNDDMRKISAGVALFVAPTLVGSIYGMNFDHMPELGWGVGYPAALLLMVSIVVLLFVVFKRSGWL
jgi:magnesium transporter